MKRKKHTSIVKAKKRSGGRLKFLREQTNKKNKLFEKKKAEKIAGLKKKNQSDLGVGVFRTVANPKLNAALRKEVEDRVIRQQKNYENDKLSEQNRGIRYIEKRDPNIDWEEDIKDQ